MNNKTMNLPFYIGDTVYVVDYTIEKHYVVKPFIVKGMDISIADNYVHIKVCGEIVSEKVKFNKPYGFLSDCFVTEKEAQSKADVLNKEYNYNYFE